jgi:hypothetical protein
MLVVHCCRLSALIFPAAPACHSGDSDDTGSSSVLIWLTPRSYANAAADNQHLRAAKLQQAFGANADYDWCSYVVKRSADSHGHLPVKRMRHFLMARLVQHGVRLAAPTILNCIFQQYWAK